MSEEIQIEDIVPNEFGGERLDKVLVELFPDFSRSRLQSWIKSGNVTVNGDVKKAKERLIGGEQIIIDAVVEDQDAFEPENIDIDVVYEDDSIAIINKPVGMVVHPAAGNWTGTLLNALLFRYPAIGVVPRAGIVHRLDKDTSGLMVVAKTIEAHKDLVEQLQERSVSREYLALVYGYVTSGGTIDEPIGRHYKDRKKMAVVLEGQGKEAVTHYRVEERFEDFSLLRAKLETGRTHQIRVHMSYIHYPLVGDGVYGGRARSPKGASEELRQAIRGFPRQALHATKLGLIHPGTKEYMEWEVPIPADMDELINIIRDN